MPEMSSILTDDELAIVNRALERSVDRWRDDEHRALALTVAVNLFLRGASTEELLVAELAAVENYVGLRGPK
jgi:hypothetical protein